MSRPPSFPNHVSRFSAFLALSLAACATTLRAQSYNFAVASAPAPNVTSEISGAAGIAVDAAGAIYVGSSWNHVVYKLDSTGKIVARYGAPGAGALDGPAGTARFRAPRNLALDAAGNIYVADSGNHAIRKITPDGNVSTLAGALEIPGAADGAAAAARFTAPEGLAIDGAGNLFAADTGNHTIRKITPGGVVTTLAGAPGVTGSADGPAALARFNAPQGLAVDAAGNIFIADSSNHVIRKLTPAGLVSLVAGRTDSRGNFDATGGLARFTYPQGVTVEKSGQLFVADSGNRIIRKVSPAGEVTTIGGNAISYYDLGLGAAGVTEGPRALTFDPAGNLLITDTYDLKRGTPSDKLVITVQPSARGSGVALGSTLRLFTTAIGAGPISYRWLKNGTPIAGATSATLTFAAAQNGDAGTYSVVVSNSSESVTSKTVQLAIYPTLLNDNFTDAQLLSGTSGQFTINMRGATAEPNEPTHYEEGATANSVWYRWTAPQDGTAIFSVGPEYTYGSAYTGDSFATLARVTPGRTGSYVRFSAVRGTTYSLAFGSGIYSTGTVIWRLIPNDNFANAIPLAGNSGTATANNSGATLEAGESDHGAPGFQDSIWYSWTPTIDGVADFFCRPKLFWATMEAFTGDTLAQLVRVPQTVPSELSGVHLQFVARAGTAYRIAISGDPSTYMDGTGKFVGSGDNFSFSWSLAAQPSSASVFTSAPRDFTSANTFAARLGTDVKFSVTVLSASPADVRWFRDGVAVPGGTGAEFTLANAQRTDAGSYTAVVTNSAGSSTTVPVTLKILAPPPNDNFTEAIALSGTSGSINGTNVDATGEANEPAHKSYPPGRSNPAFVWYRWTPPISGLATISKADDRLVVAAYTGTSLANLRQVAWGYAPPSYALNIAVTAGNTYYFAVGEYGYPTVPFRLNWQLSPVVAIATPPANQTVAPGADAMFAVTASGDGVTYQWNRNGVAIPGATSATLTVANVQGGADAAYTVTATNATGSVTSAPATLSVAAPVRTALNVRHARGGGGLLWAIAAHDDTLVTVGDSGVILVSTDAGVTWSPRVSGTSNWLVGAAYGAGQFVVVGDRGLILRSPDGAAWTPAFSSGTAQRLNNVLFAAGRFVAVGEGGAIVTSFDGDLWAPVSSGVTTWLHGLAFHEGLGAFAASGQNGVFLTSPDALTWTRLPIAGLISDLEATVAVDSYAHFVSIGQSGVVAAVRQDKIVTALGDTFATWNASLGTTATAARFRGLTQGAGALFATGEGGRIVSAASDAGPWFTLPSGTGGNLLAGLYHRNTLFVVGENLAILQSDPVFASRFLNLSARAMLRPGAEDLACGFVINGAQKKQVLIRAAGPALATVGLVGGASQVAITVRDATGAPLAKNSGWSTNANSAAIAAATARAGAFPFASGSADSALLLTLEPGNYTAQTRNLGATSALALAEVYDLDSSADTTARALNLSALGQSGPGAAKLIAGFVIDGAAARRVLIRAIGPGLAAFGVAGTITAPQLDLYTARGLLHHTAGAWNLETNSDEIRASTEAVGAFRLVEQSRDSAMLVTLLPGNWTVQAGGSTGVALLEVYEVP